MATGKEWGAKKVWLIERYRFGGDWLICGVGPTKKWAKLRIVDMKRASDGWNKKYRARKFVEAL